VPRRHPDRCPALCRRGLSRNQHRVIFMDEGRIAEDAKKEDFFGKPRSERAQQFLSKILHH